MSLREGKSETEGRSFTFTELITGY